jgi:hypothetical protein
MNTKDESGIMNNEDQGGIFWLDVSSAESIKLTAINSAKAEVTVDLDWIRVQNLCRDLRAWLDKTAHLRPPINPAEPPRSMAQVLNRIRIK